VVVSGEKLKEADLNGWDLSKAFAESTGSVYRVDLYSFYKYDNIGISKKKSGKIKCYCTDILETKEIFDSETKIDDWNTGKAKSVRTDQLLGSGN